MPEKEETVEMCEWKNRGQKSRPYWYVAGCNKSTVNVAKYMKKRGFFIEKCPFCNKIVQWSK